jgi:hypothetical protein
VPIFSRAATFVEIAESDPELLLEDEDPGDVVPLEHADRRMAVDAVAAMSASRLTLLVLEMDMGTFLTSLTVGWCWRGRTTVRRGGAGSSRA